MSAQERPVAVAEVLTIERIGVFYLSYGKKPSQLSDFVPIAVMGLAVVFLLDIFPLLYPTLHTQRNSCLPISRGQKNI